MLDASIQQRVLDLRTDATLSHRDIAKRLAVSRGFVAAVVQRGKVRHHKDGDVSNSSRGRKWEHPSRKTLRYKCPGCGYLVNLEPCVICRVKKARGEE